ncbi:MAG: DUF4065 domain-containing protein [Proteobacteria bacterium]|nr:DUF4065 domain-containing protein [Pseudomonadota bacterium]
MANVFDVATYILTKQNEMSAMKLQKLVYYCQAWSLVWDDMPLFDERIEAWANGPVVPVLYDKHKGHFLVNAILFSDFCDTIVLTPNQKDTINVVLDSYGNRSAQWLSDQTHSEDPWKSARKGIPCSERSNSIISLDSMSEYYQSI